MEVEIIYSSVTAVEYDEMRKVFNLMTEPYMALYELFGSITGPTGF